MTDPNTPPPAYQQPSGYPQQPAGYPQQQPYPPQDQPSTQPPAWTQAPSYQQSAYPAPSYGSDPASSGPVPGRTLGIVALIGSVVIAGLSILWLILGIVALVKSRRAGRKNGFAIAAIIISVLALILSIVAIGYAIYFGVTIAQLCGQYGSGTYEINGNPVQITCS